MVADPFAGVFLSGRPTVADLIALAESQGYGVRVKDGRPALVAFRKGGDRAVVEALSKVLGREPYRSSALSLAGLPAAVAITAPAPKPLPVVKTEPETVREPEACRTCRALVCGGEVICGVGECPYTKVTRGDPQASGGAWEWWRMVHKRRKR